jgi:hypothetical protein
VALVRLSFPRVAVLITAIILLGNLAYVGVSLRYYFLENNIRVQIEKYRGETTNIADADMAGYYTASVCVKQTNDPVCVVSAERRADTIHGLCESYITKTIDQAFGPPDERQARAIASYKYCTFGDATLDGWIGDVKPTFSAELSALILFYIEFASVGLMWSIWTSAWRRVSLIAGFALSMISYFAALERYSAGFQFLVAAFVLVAVPATVWVGCAIVRWVAPGAR